MLEDGDIIHLPKVPKVVLVTGRVAKSGGVIYKENEDIDYYIEQSGGYTWDSDAGDTKVIKITGEILDGKDVKRILNIKDEVSEPELQDET